MASIGHRTSTPGKTIDISVLIGGKPQPLYRRPGDGAVFVAGVPGESYTLRATVLGGSRAEVITTVDGRNTLKDEPGDARQNHGLVISGLGVFAGWRISDDEVREFVFGDPATSVAAQAGQPGNVGVIGFAAYRERSWNYHGSSTIPVGSVTFDSNMTTRGVAVAAAASASASSLGTGIGEARADHVGRTSFERQGEPDILVIRYDTAEALTAAGIIGPPDAQAFPGIGTGYEKYAAS